MPAVNALLSSAWTPFSKFVVPVLVPGAMIGATIGVARAHDYGGVIFFGLSGLLAGGLSVRFSRRLVHVALDGTRGLRFDDLRGHSLCLSWAQLESIGTVWWARSRTYVVSFRASTRLGRRVFFMPAGSCQPQQVEELRERIAEHAPVQPNPALERTLSG